MKEKSTQTERFQQIHRRFFGLTSKNALQLLSALILPLMLGVFTVVITFHQQKTAREQRIEDLQLARQQRIEDLEVARQHRLEDKNESRLQREQDWDIAILNQEVQSKIIIDRYRDEVLVTYIKEIGELLKENNGSLTSYPITATLARVKTLNVFRQLDGTRSVHVIRFLYEAGQLMKTDQSAALDISTAELSNIDTSAWNSVLTINKLSLAGVFLKNSTFSHATLHDVDFSSAQLINVDFAHATLFHVNFTLAKLNNVSFSFAKLDAVQFSLAQLTKVDFSSAEIANVVLGQKMQPLGVNFSLAKLTYVNFLSAELNKVDFSFAELHWVDFIYAKVFSNIFFSYDKQYFGVKFSFAKLYFANFSLADVYNFDFSSAICDAIDFFSAKLVNVKFTSAKVEIHRLDGFSEEPRGIRFSFTKLDNVNFSSAKFAKIDFSSAKLVNVDFSFAELTHTDFSYAKIGSSHLISNRNQPWIVNFSFSRLKKVKFLTAMLVHVNFSLATLIDIDFSFAQLDNVDFLSANIGSITYSYYFHSSWSVIFSSAKLNNVNFSFAQLRNVDFSSVQLGNVDYIFVLLNKIFASVFALDFTYFWYTYMPETCFLQASSKMIHFDHADLSMSVFWHANAKSAFFNNTDLTNVNFSLANLQQADFTNAIITDSQLQSALSIQNARLPNGLLGRDTNLVKNGHADCNSSFNYGWQLENGNISIMPFDAGFSNCYFILSSNAIGASMSQRINLTKIWDSVFWDQSTVVLHARMTDGVFIQLNGMSYNGSILNKEILNATGYNITMILDENMHELEVLVKFTTSISNSGQNTSWCDEIELFIDYDKKNKNKVK